MFAPPKIARLSLSVPPEVKMMLFGSVLSEEATEALDSFKSLSALMPRGS